MSADDSNSEGPTPEDPPRLQDRPDEAPGSALERSTGEQAVVEVDALGTLARQAPPATPSRTARWLAFAAILIGGACGGLIGWGFTDLQCSGDCGTWSAMGGLIGAVSGAGGLAIVAVLGLRAMAEWESVQDAEAHARHPGRARPGAQDS